MLHQMITSNYLPTSLNRGTGQDLTPLVFMRICVKRYIWFAYVSANKPLEFRQFKFPIHHQMHISIRSYQVSVMELMHQCDNLPLIHRPLNAKHTICESSPKVALLTALVTCLPFNLNFCTDINQTHKFIHFGVCNGNTAVCPIKALRNWSKPT